MSVDISIKSKRLEYEFEIKEKITFVLGDSATGKTKMVSLINNLDNPSVKISVSNGFDLISISESEFSKFIKHANRRIQENKYSSLKEYWADKDNFPIVNSVIVIDDENFVESNEFATFVNADKYNYYIIINRTQISKIGYSVHEVYELKANGKLHWLDRKYNSPVGDNQCLNPDFIVTEGIGSDFQFFEKHYSGSGARILNPSYNNKNKNTGGKNNLIAMLSENAAEFRGKKVILFIDISAFGAEYESLVEMCRENYIQAYINKNYLSFEYLLLNTNLINDTGLSDFQHSNLLKYVTLEKLFTDRLRQVLSEQKLLTYSKSKLSVCFLEDCCSNLRYRSALCNRRIQYQGKNKLAVLLKGTKFQYMLQWKN